MPFKGLINKASNKIKGALENSDTFSKVVSAKKKLKLAGIIAGAVGVLATIFIIISVISYFLGLVQEIGERVENTLKSGCILCTTEELVSLEEKQFKNRINIIEDQFGSEIDRVVLASTVLFQGDYYEIMASQYSANFDEDKYRDAWSNFASKLKEGTLGDDPNYDGITTEESDLLDLAALVMVNSSVNGKYNEESYKAALVGKGIVPSDSVANAFVCTVTTFRSALAAINPFQYMYDLYKYKLSHTLADRTLYVVNTKQVCDYGFIEGTYHDVHDITDEDKKEQKKKDIANEIIEFAEFYKELFYEDDSCVYTGSASTGDYANWKQWGESWSDISLGGGGSLGKIGCTTTASAMLIAKSGTLITNLPSGYSEFNPGAFATSLNAHGGYSSGGGMTWSGWNDIAPNFNSGTDNTYVDISSDAELAKVIKNELSTLVDGKYQKYILLCFRHSESDQHWVAVDYVDGDVVRIMDPGRGATTLSEKYVGWTVYAYRVMWATDVTSDGTRTSNNTLDTKNSTYQSRIDGLSEFYQGGDRLRNVPIGNTIYMVAGCLPSSLMAAYYMYTGETPDVTKFTDDIIKQGAWIDGGGGVTSPYFDTLEGSPIITQNWGLSLQPIKTDMNTVIQTLKSGKKILVNIRPKSGMYKNGSGHFMMLDHYDESSDKIYVFNPSGYSDGQGYQSKDTVQNEILNHLNNGLWEINSSKVSALNSCGGDAGDEDVLEYIAGVEGGDESSCNYKGKGANTGYGSVDLKDGAGMTSAFGVTVVGDTQRALSMGYSTFVEDMENGCADKEWIYKIFVRGYTDLKEEVISKLGVAGINNLSNYQIGALASVAYGGNGPVDNIIERIKKYGADSYEVFNCFVSIPCGFTNNNYKDGLANRRAADYELFATGNYKAVNPGKNYAYFAAIDSMSALKVYEKTWPTGK